MSIYDQYEVNAEAENNGVWVTDISDPEEFLIASSDNIAFAKAIARMYLPHTKTIRAAQKLTEDGKDIPEKTAKLLADIDLKCFCKHVLKDWKNVKTRGGKTIKYTPEEGFKLLSQPNMRKLKDAIYSVAADHARFAVEEKEETVKNLPKTSAGS